MAQKFEYFVVFAEMRTGSNFLEANLNAFDGIACHGEAFNPHFIGYPNREEILGVSQEARDSSPTTLLDAVKETPDTLSGFRFFHDHDGRVLGEILDDPKCAKIILTRNPMDSYVSWKIAQATGQWKLTDVRKRKDSKVHFDAQEFTQHIANLQDFQVYLLNSLQRSGQTAFYVAYEDLKDIEVMNGLARYLGVEGRLEELDGKLKPQNPSHISEKVENFDDIPATLAELDQFNLARTPNFEPRRGPAVPTYVAAPESGLMFLPIAGAPNDDVQAWLAQLDGASIDQLITGMNQKTLRQWKRQKTPHRSFTVIRHPVARAHAAFCRVILSTGPGSYSKIRRTLRNRFGLSIPDEMPDETYDVAAHQMAFAQYLQFVRANLAGQTAIRQDGYWATQAAIVSGFNAVSPPDAVLREEELQEGLSQLARSIGSATEASVSVKTKDTPYQLADIYSAHIEELTRDAYQRDYITFGFGDWQA